MNEIFTLKNDLIEISIKETGAELCSIRKVGHQQEYMWQADPAVWAGHAPVLFPIIGALKNDTYFYQGEKYSLPRHGFIRNNPKLALLKSDENFICMGIQADSEILKMYPFHFEFQICYSLNVNAITITHQVRNTGNEAMYFSLGAHPAFRCPLEDDEDYSDYYLLFDQSETAYTHQIDPEGLIAGKTDLILNNSQRIDLHSGLFDHGALVFKDIKSRSVCLASRKSGKRVEVKFEGFPYLGIWAKPKANYVCIEPWMGIADPVNTNQQLENKEGILKLERHSCFEAKYSITIC